MKSGCKSQENSAIYQTDKRAGRVCYKSENNTTDDSAKPFVGRMIAE